MRVVAVDRKIQRVEEEKEQLSCKEIMPQQSPHFVWGMGSIQGTTLKSLQDGTQL